MCAIDRVEQTRDTVWIGQRHEQHIMSGVLQVDVLNNACRALGHTRIQIIAG